MPAGDPVNDFEYKKYKVETKRFFMMQLVDSFKKNKVFGVAMSMVVILLIVVLILFSEVGFYKLTAVLMADLLVISISLSEDARIFYKAVSMGIIFVCIIIFLLL